MINVERYKDMATEKTNESTKFLRGKISDLKDLVNAVRSDVGDRFRIGSEELELITKSAGLAGKVIGFNNYGKSAKKLIDASGINVPYNFVEEALHVVNPESPEKLREFYTNLENELGELLSEKEMKRLMRMGGAVDSIKKHALEYAAHMTSVPDNDVLEDLSVIKYFSSDSEVPEFYIVPQGQSEVYFNSLVAAVLSDKPTMVYGPTGIAKTLSINYLAAVWNERKIPVPHASLIPVITAQCTRDSDSYSLVGHDTLRGNVVAFQKGPLPIAIEEANRRGFAILVLDELAALSPETQKLINPLSNERRAVIFGERAWFLNGDSKLFIVATTNVIGNGYGGINQINVDLSRRFVVKKALDFPNETEEEKILEHFTDDHKLRKNLIKLARHTRNTDNQDMIPLSTAILTNAIGLIHAYELSFTDRKVAFNMAITDAIVNSYTDLDDRTAIIEKVKDIFPGYGDGPSVKNKKPLTYAYLRR